MKEELEQKTQSAQSILDSLVSRVKHEDQRKYLELMVKTQIVELEKDELEYNLRLQEKLNRILMDELKRVRGICESNNIVLSEEEPLEDMASRPGSC